MSPAGPAQPRATALLQAVDVRIAAGGRTLVEGLTFAVRPGEIWALLGANGTGKTTLLHTLAGLQPPAGGEVRLRDQPLAGWRIEDAARLRAFLPQFVHDAFAAPVLDIVLTGRHPHLSRLAWEGAAETRIAHDALAALELDHLARRDVSTLSGGERRRVAIAALLAQDTPLLLLDEPVAHLDLHHQIATLGHLAALANERGKAVLFSVHDPTLAARFATHALLLGPDGASAGSCAGVLDIASLSRAYRHPLAVGVVAGRSVYVPR